MKSCLTPQIIVRRCPFLWIQKQGLSLKECLLSTYYLHTSRMQRWIRFLHKGFWLSCRLVLRGLSMSLVNKRYQHMHIALDCNTFSFPSLLISALFMHRKKHRFVRAPAFNRLITFGISSFPPGKFTWVILCSARLACSKEVVPSSFTVLIGQKEIDLSWMGIIQVFLLQEDTERASVHLRLFVDEKVTPLCSSLREPQSETFWVHRKGGL